MQSHHISSTKWSLSDAQLTDQSVIVEVVDLEGEGGLDFPRRLLREGAVQVEEVVERQRAVILGAEDLESRQWSLWDGRK